MIKYFFKRKLTFNYICHSFYTIYFELGKKSYLGLFFILTMLCMKHAKVLPMPIQWQHSTHTIPRIDLQIPLFRQRQLQQFLVPTKPPFNVHIRKQQRFIPKKTDNFSRNLCKQKYRLSVGPHSLVELWNQLLPRLQVQNQNNRPTPRL